MKKYYLIRKTVLLLLLILLVGCAKREPDVLVDTDTMERFSVEEIAKNTQGNLTRNMEDSSDLPCIDADVIIPDTIKVGKASKGFPDIMKIQKTLCDGKTMEKLSENCWGIKSNLDSYPYENYYEIKHDNAIYYNAALKAGTIYQENSVQIGEEALKKQADNILHDLQYQAVLSYMEVDDVEHSVILHYTPAVNGIPVVSADSGLGGTQVCMSEEGISEMLLKSAWLIDDKEDVSLLSLDTILKLMERDYRNGTLSPIGNDDEICCIRLAYYVDEQMIMKPVWCFEIDFMGLGWEYVLYCYDAQTGEILFDYNNYSVESEDGQE